ncbi:MAG: ribosome assembly factor SBDS [Nanoarchaeota archaeon]
MPNVEARIKIKGKHYEIVVDLDEALKIKNNKGNILSALQSANIYTDSKKGNIIPQKDLIEAFGTSDIYEIAKKIIISGEIQKTQEYRDEEKERKINQIISLIIRNASDQHGRPYTEERIRSAVHDIHYHFDNRPPEQQMQEIIKKLKEIIPIKIETKKIKIIIPAQHTGKVYSILNEYKESEEWMSNGNLQAVLNIPAGLIIDFYDKLNSLTHGSVQSEEIKDKV